MRIYNSIFIIDSSNVKVPVASRYTSSNIIGPFSESCKYQCISMSQLGNTNLDAAPHVEEPLAGRGGRAARDGRHPAPAPALGSLGPAPLHAQPQLRRQPVRPDPVLHPRPLLLFIKFRFLLCTNASQSHKLFTTAVLVSNFLGEFAGCWFVSISLLRILDGIVSNYTRLVAWLGGAASQRS